MDTGMQHVTLCMVDNSMDTYGNFRVDVNSLPIKCDYCTFPDLDFVPSPYLLARGLASSAEISVLDLGNLVVRPRVRDVLIEVLGDQIECRPTCHWKSKEPTEWTVIVPRAIRPSLAVTVKSTVPRCPNCGEPRTAHGSQQVPTGVPDPVMDQDIFKARFWWSYEQVGEKATYYWMHVLKLKEAPKPRDGVWTRIMLSREVTVSVRLYKLLKALKVVGLVARLGVVPPATADDEEWVRQKLAVLSGKGIANALGTQSRDTKRSADLKVWFEKRLTKRKGEGLPESALALAEQRLGNPLPESYRRLMSKRGTQTFRDIEGEKGFDVSIVEPAELDTSESWLMGPDSPTGDDTPTKPLLFAHTGHGDCFVFDTAGGLVDNEYPVFIYRHEMHGYEPYAENLMGCIKRFAEKD